MKVGETVKECSQVSDPQAGRTGLVVEVGDAFDGGHVAAVPHAGVTLRTQPHQGAGNHRLAAELVQQASCLWKQQASVCKHW